ncbi:MAG: hypothetical protein ACR2PX_07355 [Endozoicomonas sp.]|uniref:hypothetical protein n=1 Tax=Endozoicomonas sp. TaxID=1892382 RepID=UPI003D9AD23E
MKIYKISSSDDFSEVFPNLVGMMKKLGNPKKYLDAVRENKPLKDLWFEQEGIIQSKKQVADICKPYSGQLMLSSIVRDSLDSELATYGEFLPVTLQGEKYWIMNLQNSIQAAGNNSSPDRSDKDWFDKITFKEENIRKQLLWTTSLDNDNQIFCTHRFISLIEESDFKGLKFRPSLPAT